MKSQFINICLYIASYLRKDSHEIQFFNSRIICYGYTASKLGMCAERNAIANMITNGESQIDKVVAIVEDGSVGAPCGACREYMMQLDKELDAIRKKTKELPSLLGGEKYIRISESDFERVMDMTQASGTLEKLNEAYDRDMDMMQGKIDKLTSQVQILKDKITKTAAFLKFKGLLEEFKELLKPKSLKRDLQDKQVMS